MATKKETTAEQTAESTMPTQEEMQKLLEENARLKAERDAAEAARIDAVPSSVICLSSLIKRF